MSQKDKMWGRNGICVQVSDCMVVAAEPMVVSGGDQQGAGGGGQEMACEGSIKTGLGRECR